MLFPGYVFIALDLKMEPWGRVNGTIGVGKLLPEGEAGPKPLPTGFVEELRELHLGGQLTAVRAELAVFNFSRGDRVLVRAGGFEGFTGEFVRYRKGSLMLLMTLLGREIELGFPAHQVVPAPQIAA